MTYRTDSFYASTTIRDFYLDIWNDPGLPFSDDDDDEYIIPNKYNQRPDLLAHEIYGSSRYWWVFALRNKEILIDPVEDFLAGISIRVPTKSSILSLIER